MRATDHRRVALRDAREATLDSHASTRTAATLGCVTFFTGSPNRLGLTLLLSLAACATQDQVGAARAPVVYDVDDRVEPYESSSASLRALAESAIAGQVSTYDLDQSDPAHVRVTSATTLGEAAQLCTGERFADQITAASCSGTLIDNRHILTAGHCIASARNCAGTDAWVLGLRYESPGVLAPLTSDDVYTCSRVVVRTMDGTVDYAVIELDRDVVGHTPAAFAGPVAPLATGTALTLIGHPDGIPIKIASNGAVISSGPRTFTASVDAFAGNSGSGVFNDLGQLVGVLDSGAMDYQWSGSCFVVNVVNSATERGEGLSYAAPAIAAFCAAAGAGSALCDCSAGMCGTGDAGAPDAAGLPPPAPAKDLGCRCALVGAGSALPPTWSGALGLAALLLVARRRRAARQSK